MMKYVSNQAVFYFSYDTANGANSCVKYFYILSNKNIAYMSRRTIFLDHCCHTDKFLFSSICPRKDFCAGPCKPETRRRGFKGTNNMNNWWNNIQKT